MKRLAMAITLSCALSGSALAGEMPMVGPVVAPPPSGASSSVAPGDVPTLCKPGEIPTDGSSVVLSAVLAALSLLSI
jgi:hypothetical protein